MADADAPAPIEGRNEGRAQARLPLFFPYYWTKVINLRALFFIYIWTKVIK